MRALCNWIPVRMAALDGDGPTGTFWTEIGTRQGRIVPW